MNTDNFLINNSDIEAARDICKLIDDGSVRNRAVANSMAAEIAANYFDKENYEIDSASGLHNIGFVLESLEISDIYVNNNYIDVRIFFNEDEMSVPVAHFENDLLPVAYMFIRINDDLSGAGVVGFIEPNAIAKENSVNGYYQVKEDDLKSFYDIEPLLTNIEDVGEVEDKDVFSYLDKNLEDVSRFYKTLLKSKISRKKLAKAAKAKEIFRFVSVTREFSIKADNETVIENNKELSLDNEELSLDNETDLISDSELLPESLDSDDLSLEESDSLLEVEAADEIEAFDLEPTEEDDTLVPDFEVSDESFSLELEETDGNEIGLLQNVGTESNNNASGDETSSDENSDLAAALERSISSFSANIGLATENTGSINSEEINEHTEEHRELDIQGEIQMLDSLNLTASANDVSIDEELSEISEEGNDVEPLIFENNIEEDNNVEPLVLENSVEEEHQDYENIKEALDMDLKPEDNEQEEVTEEGFNFSTVTTPSLSEDDAILEELSNEVETEEPIQQAENDDDSKDQEQQIEALFNNGNNNEAVENSEKIEQEDDLVINQPKTKSSVNPLIGLIVLLIIGASGYIGYTKFFATSTSNDILNSDIPSDTKQVVNSEPVAAVEDAMPIETVTNVTQNNNNEGISEAIPVIEQDLDASILVSNLKVDWEVPAGYAANTSAKRYLVKLGKIIQLNLKTELLLLSKPPITNKIAVEIKYNSDSRRFEATSVTVSSGEKSVDALILQTVNKALAMNLSMNTDSFANLQGNPVLIIHL